MSINKTSPEVVELVNSIEEARVDNPSKQLDLAVKLYELASKSDNQDLIDYANCSLGDACARNFDFSQAIYYLVEGINGVAQTDEYELTCRSYNEIGILYHNQSHYISAEESFLSCIQLARAKRLYLYEAMACGNLAALCEDMEDYEDSLQYRYRALEAFKFVENEEIRYSFSVSVMSFIVRLYCIMDDAEHAKQSYTELLNLKEEGNVTDRDFELEIAKLSYSSYIGDEISTQQAEEKCLEFYYHCTDFVVYYEETRIFLHYMLEKGHLEEVEKMLNFYETTFVNEEMINQYLNLEEIKVHLYEAIGPREKMLESAYKCFELNLKKNVDLRKSFKTTIRLQSEIIQQKTKNLFLSAQAQTDVLTNLPNRSKLNAVIDELFTMANNEGRNLAVEMLDVDCFKQINDTMGHAKGDEVLTNIGKLLKEQTGEQVFAARYGGDEFILYYYDMCDEEILGYTNVIKEGIKKIKDELKLDKLTVSQGIVNHIPNEYNRAWDYMMVADEALYYIKNHGKDRAILVHSLQELKEQQ